MTKRKPAHPKTLEEYKSKSFLVDLDDTITDTHKVFMIYRDKVWSEITKKTGLDESAIEAVWEPVLIKAFEKYSVNPEHLWKEVLKEFRKKIELPDSLVKKSIKTLDKIYTHTPEIHPDAQEFLDASVKIGLKLYLVTHASDSWTDFKLDKLDLRKYFKDVYTISPDKHKDHYDWIRAAEAFGVDTANSIAIGDSIKNDIIAASDAGIPIIYWVNRKNGWSAYTEGELPEGVIEINKLTELPWVS